MLKDVSLTGKRWIPSGSISRRMMCMTCQNASHLQATPKIPFQICANTWLKWIFISKGRKYSSNWFWLLYYKCYFGMLLKLSNFIQMTKNYTHSPALTLIWFNKIKHFILSWVFEGRTFWILPLGLIYNFRLRFTTQFIRNDQTLC